MEPLVNKTDLSKFKHVADSVKNSVIWPQVVLEAQNLDVKYWLGDGLLIELMTQAATDPVDYSDANELLLNGGEYTYNNKSYLFQGLKACIIYFAFARFTGRSPYNHTAAGVTVKDSDFSTPASDKAIQRLVTEYKLTAESIKDEVVLFLKRKATEYPLFRSGAHGSRPRTFTVIGD